MSDFLLFLILIVTVYGASRLEQIGKSLSKNDTATKTSTENKCCKR